MTTTDASSEHNDSAQPETDEQSGATTEQHKTQSADKSKTAQKSVVTPKFALVVDAHRGNRLRLEVRLLSAGVRAKTFSSGDAALKALLSGELAVPDVIIVGQKMPALDGLQVIKYVKRTPRAAKIPQLQYCIKDGELCIVQARTLGAVGADSTTFEAVDLNEVLARLNLSNRLPRAEQQDATLQSLASEVDAHLETLSQKESADVATGEVAVTADGVTEGGAGAAASEAAKASAAGATAIETREDANDANEDEAVSADDATDPQSTCERDAEQSQAGMSAQSDMQASAREDGVPSHGGPNTASSAQSDADESSGDASASEAVASSEHAAAQVPVAAPEDQDPFAEKPPKRLVDAEHLNGLISASASNDAESFREHTSVVAYLRSLERKGRRTPPSRRRADLWHEKRRHNPPADQNTWRDALGGDSAHLSNHRWLGLESQRLEFQERLDRSLESLQHQFEFEMMRQTGAMQEHMGALLDAQLETIRDELLTTRHHQRVDRWLRILVVVVLLLMPSLWVLTQMTAAPVPVPAMGETASAERLETVTPTPQAAAPVPADGLSEAERLRVTQSVEQLLNAAPPPEFGAIALGAREAIRLEQALEMLSVIDFQGVVQVINHVSPYCVQYDANGKASLDQSEEAIAQCFMAPENTVAAETLATEQSVEFGNLLSRYNRPEVPISVVVVPAIAEGDFWSVTETFQPSATGEKLTARAWNERARSRNRIEYRLVGG